MLPRWPVLPLRLLCLFLAQGCGRYGFDDGLHLIDDAGFARESDPATAEVDPVVPTPEPPFTSDAASTPLVDGGGSDDSLTGDPPPARFDCGADKTNVLMCSTFDDPALSEWTQPKEFNGKSVATDGALIASTGLTGGVAAVYRALPNFQGKDLYLRATLKLPSDYDLTHVDLTMLGKGFDSGDTCVAISVLSNGMLALSFGNELLPRTSDYVLPRDRWFCLSAHITLDPKLGSVRVDVDGVERLRVEGVDTESEATMNMVGVGIHWSSLLQAPAIVLADDFVLSTVPTPCSPIAP